VAEPYGRRAVGVLRSNRPSTIDDVAHATAIHGLVRWRPFRIDSVNQNRCSLTLLLHPSPEYPFLSEINVTYHLDDSV